MAGVKPWLLAVALIELHGPQGQRFLLNPIEITWVREPLASDLKRFTPGVRCLVITVDGKITAVRETCAEVERKLGWHTP